VALGKVAKDGQRWFVDLRPHGRIWSLHGVPFRGEDGRVLAEGVLTAIRLAVDEGAALTDALARFQPPGKRATVCATYSRFVAAFERMVAAGDRSAGTLQQYRRYQRAEMPYWKRASLADVSFAALEDWNNALVDRGLSPKSRKNILGALHACLRWAERRGELRTLPAFPVIELREHLPTVLPESVVAALVSRVPESQRGPYLVASLMGLRPGEIRALEVADVLKGGKYWRLKVAKAVQGPRSSSPVGPTKNRRERVLPIHPAVREWLEANTDWSGRLTRAPLFPNRQGARLSHDQFWNGWARVRRGITTASLYEGTKHSFASAALESGIQMERIQKFLGHSDPRSTERYAKLSDESLEVLIESRQGKAKTTTTKD
tara:strand:- start:4455 stop:5582 length:1128 start_codon:yes stop_codon:yes gene_type:complete